MSEVTKEEIGAFIDSVAGKIRTTKTVTGRLIEETVELGLAAGLTPAEIMAHVADSLFNQCNKLTAKLTKTVFPSEHGDRYDIVDVIDEVADVSIVLKDLAYVAGVNVGEAEREKWDRFITKKFHVSPKGVVYVAGKAHMKYES